MRNATLKTTWDAPRWAHVESFVRDLAFHLNLECWTQVEKGWLREHGRLKVSGDENACQQFMDKLNLALSEYNGET